MASLSFPAIGTGNMRFPRDLVSRVLLREIQNFSRQAVPRHLGQVLVVVHPSDMQTVDVSRVCEDISCRLCTQIVNVI